MGSGFTSRQAYEHYIYTLAERYPSIKLSTVTYIPADARSGRVEGMIIAG